MYFRASGKVLYFYLIWISMLYWNWSLVWVSKLAIHAGFMYTWNLRLILASHCFGWVMESRFKLWHFHHHLFAMEEALLGTLLKFSIASPNLFLRVWEESRLWGRVFEVLTKTFHCDIKMAPKYTVVGEQFFHKLAGIIIRRLLFPCSKMKNIRRRASGIGHCAIVTFCYQIRPLWSLSNQYTSVTEIFHWSILFIILNFPKENLENRCCDSVQCAKKYWTRWSKGCISLIKCTFVVFPCARNCKAQCNECRKSSWWWWSWEVQLPFFPTKQEGLAGV